MAKLLPTRAWGALLLRLRKDAGLSGTDVVDQLANLGVKLDRRTLYTYEAGRVTAPAAAVVWGLACIYRADVEDLLKALVVTGNATSPNAKLGDVKKSKAFEATSEDFQLMEVIRKLPPTLRNECREFIRFQVERSRTYRGGRSGRLRSKP